MLFNMKKWFAIFLSGSLISAFFLTALPATALASAPEPASQVRLENQFAASKKADAHSMNLITNAQKTATTDQNHVNRLAASGVDVTRLQGIVTTYQNQIDLAQSFANDLASQVAVHAGFSDNKVTDMATARATEKAIAHDQFMISSIMSTATRMFNKQWSISNVRVME